jgi:AcrR family transcriptional regulator
VDPGSPLATPQQARAQITRQKLLDAAVDELLDHGYARLTTPGVAARAGVSRGAQQGHFPRKSELVASAVRHLTERQLEELRERLADVPSGRQRVTAGLNVLFDQYSGRLFAVVVELSLSARDDPELRQIVTRAEQHISQSMHETATTIFGPGFPQTQDVSSRWTTVLSAIRGLALLKLLGHDAEGVDRQWRRARKQLVELLPS